MPDQIEAPVAPSAPTTPAPVAPAAPAPVAEFSWKSQLTPDYANSPTMQKFPDTKDGFNQAIKSHLSLEQMLGHEKVPIPKGKDDAEGWAIFSKALGVPEKPDGYELPDPNFPDSMKGLTFDKAKFAEIVHSNKLTPDAAKGLWGAYTEMSQQVYNKAMKDHQDHMTAVVNQLRGEWGDAYQSKVELGQMVINKFSENKEMNDHLTATLTKDAYGIKLLAKIGDQFSENKIGDFKYSRYSVTPEEAQKEIDGIRQDPKHPYNNDRASQAERDRAIEHVNALLSVALKKK